MGWSQKLSENQMYVLDLVERPDGWRGLKPRKPDAPQDEGAVFETMPYRGGDLQTWQEYQKLETNVRLSDGSTFRLDAHGFWYTEEEFRQWSDRLNVELDEGIAFSLGRAGANQPGERNGEGVRRISHPQQDEDENRQTEG